MPCPDTGAWRAWIDDAVTLDGADEHLSGCGPCAATVDRLRDDARHAAAAMALLDDAPVGAAPTGATPSMPATADGRVLVLPRRRGRPFAAAAAVVLVAVALVATPGGRTATADFLASFRSERFSLVELTSNEAAEAVVALSRLGSADVSAAYGAPTPVADVAEAARRTGIDVVAPDATVTTGDPELYVTDERELRFRFDAGRTQRYLSEQGLPEAVLPAGYDGSTLVVTVPAGVLQLYRNPDGLSQLAVGQAGVVTADVDGDIDLETLRSFLLGLPGLPQSVVTQLRAIDDWRGTLPIPIPIDELDATETTIAGGEALLVSAPGFGRGLLWQRDGVVTGVAGPVGEDRLRSIAESLRPAP